MIPGSDNTPIKSQSSAHKSVDPEAQKLEQELQALDGQLAKADPSTKRHAGFKEVVKSTLVGAFFGGTVPVWVGGTVAAAATGGLLFGGMGYAAYLLYKRKNRNEAEETFRELRDRKIETMKALKDNHYLSPEKQIELQNLIAECDALKTDYFQALDSNETLGSQIITLQEDLSSKNKAIEALQNDVVLITGNLNDMQQAHESLRQAYANLQQNDTDKLNTVRANHDKAEKDFAANQEILKKKIDTLEASLQTKYLELEQTKKALEAAEQKQKMLGSQATTSESARRAIEKRLQETLKTISELTRSHQMHQKDALEKQAELEAALRRSENMSDDIRQELVTLRHEKADLPKRLRDRSTQTNQTTELDLRVQELEKREQYLLKALTRLQDAQNNLDKQLNDYLKDRLKEFTPVSGAHHRFHIKPDELSVWSTRYDIGRLQAFIEAVRLSKVDEGDLKGGKAAEDLDQQLQNAASRLSVAMEAARVEYHPDIDVLPSLAQQRSLMIKALTEFRQQVSVYQQQFLSSGGTSRGFLNKNDKLQLCLQCATEEINARQKEGDTFNNQSKHIENFTSQLRQNCQNEQLCHVASFAINSLKAILQNEVEEVRDFGAGAIAKIVTDQVVGDQDIVIDSANMDFLEQQRLLLEEKRQVVKRLKPDNLPLTMKQSLSSRGVAYLDHLVRETASKLEHQTKPETLAFDDTDTTRNVPGVVLAQQMLANPNICADVHSLLSSLQASHEGLQKDHFSYEQASKAGLEAIRKHHALVYMPSMRELLIAAEHDLQQIDSKLTTESVNQHNGELKTRNGQYRREKLQVRCRAFMAIEDAYNEDTCANYSELTPHTCKDVLDCFAKANGQTLLIHDSSREQVSYHSDVVSYPLPDNHNGLLNAFFSGCTGDAFLRKNNRTQSEKITIKGGNAEPQLIFTKEDDHWQVNMSGRSWRVDPSFLIQNPDVDIPFENKQESGSAKQRDWIPVKDINDNAAILVLRKGSKDRYFLYEKGENDSLQVLPISKGDYLEERIEGTHLYWAARPKLDDENLESLPLSLTEQNDRLQETSVSTVQIKQSKRHWILVTNQNILEEKYRDIELLEKERKPVPTLLSRNVESLLSHSRIQSNALRYIARQKREVSERMGAKLATFDTSRQQFAPFSVYACFDKVSDRFYAECRKIAGTDTAIIEQQKRQRDEYRDYVFRDLTVFSGCELTPDESVHQLDAEGHPQIGTPEQVQKTFGKVVKNSRDHCMRMAQQVQALRYKMVEQIRDGQLYAQIKDSEQNRSAVSPSAGYTDQQILDQAVVLFESGAMPCGIDSPKDIDDFVTWMLAENDLKQNSRKLDQLQKLGSALERLKMDASLLSTNNFRQYTERCQQWNLDMALAATDMQAMQQRLDRIGDHEINTDPATRAIMSFERRAETVLRSVQGSNQIQEVYQVLDEIHDTMVDDLPMARVSQLGTGWGKSTMLQLWSDYACALNAGKDNRSVLVIVPTRNKQDLDHTLGRYFDQKQMSTGSLDVMADYVNQPQNNGRAWWHGETLHQIHNVLLGLPRNTRLDQRDAAVVGLRGPVVASIQDVQILMHLRKGLLAKEDKTTADHKAIQQLNTISDLLHESMVFADEWDSTLIPPLNSQLNEMIENINRAMAGFPGGQASAESIIRDHGAFIFGCKRKHLLSATTGTSYAAAIASGAVNAREVNRKCNTDPYTTAPRLWHLMELAEPVFVDSVNNEDLCRQVYQQVVNQVGDERPVLLFNSDASGQDNFKQAIRNRKLLNDARRQYAIKSNKPLTTQSQEMMYYDNHKTLCQLLPGSPVYDAVQGENIAMLPEDEAFARTSRGRDGCLSLNESVGTDAPQGMDTVGVVIGGLEQKEEGRLDLFTQQVGRVTRAMRSMHKPQQLFIVADKRAATALPGSPAKDHYLQNYEVLKKQEAKLANCFDLQQIPAAVMKAINSPLKVEKARHDDLQGVEDNVSENLERALKILEENEYAQLKLDHETLETLINLKRQQWQTKVSFVELLGNEFARRDTSVRVRKYETTLEHAAVDSALARAFAKEDIWLKGVGGRSDKPETSLAGYRMDDYSKSALSNEEVVKHVEEIITSTVSEQVAGLIRQTIPENVSYQDLSSYFHKEERIEDILRIFQKLKAEGITPDSNDPLGLLLPELKSRSLDMLQHTREHLEKIMDAANAVSSKDMDRRGKAKYGVWTKLAGSGHEHNWNILNPLLKRLDGKIKAVGEDSIDESLSVSQFLDDFCTDLSERINFVVVAIGHGGDQNRELIARQVNEMFAARGHRKKIKISGVQHNLAKLKAMAAKVLSSSGNKAKTVKNGSLRNSSDSTVPLNKLQIEVLTKKVRTKSSSPTQARQPRKTQMVEVTKYEPVNKLNTSEHYGYQDSAGTHYSLGDLKKLCQAASEAKTTREHWNRAMAFCVPDERGYVRSLGELESYLLKKYNHEADKIKEELQKEAGRISQQNQLKIKPAS